MVGHLQTAHAPLGKHRHSLSLVRCDPPPSQSARSCNITIQLLQFHCNSDETCVFQQFFTIISLFPNNLHVRHLYGFFNHILYIVFSDCWTIQLVIKEFKWSARVCGAAAILQLRLWEDLHCSATGDRSPAFCSVSSGLANAPRWEMVRLGAVSWIRTQCKDFISWQCQLSPQCHHIFQYNHLHLGAAALLSLPLLCSVLLDLKTYTLVLI